MSNLYYGYRCLKAENDTLKKLIKDMSRPSEGMLSAFRIKLDTEKIKVVCERCHQYGVVVSNCSECGGKGTHFRSKPTWVVCKHREDIVKIDRSADGKTVRFWTSASDFFEDYTLGNHLNPEGIAYIHFNINDAKRECDRLNKLYEEVL